MCSRVLPIQCQFRGEASFVTDPFALKGRLIQRGIDDKRIRREQLDYLNYALINQDTGQAFDMAGSQLLSRLRFGRAWSEAVKRTPWWYQVPPGNTIFESNLNPTRHGASVFDCIEAGRSSVEFFWDCSGSSAGAAG